MNKEYILDRSDKPTLNFINGADQAQIQITFGYFKNEPTAALFHNDTLVLIPKEVLQLALDEGWGESDSTELNNLDDLWNREEGEEPA